MNYERSISSIDLHPSLAQKMIYEFCKPYIKGKDVLDVGCWAGYFERLAVKDVKSIVGVDIDPFVIGEAQKLTPKATFKVAFGEKLPLKANSVDTVIFAEVIEHVQNEQKCIDEIYRVLRPGGTVIIMTPRKHFLSILLDPAYFLLKHRHYSIEELKRCLTKFRNITYSYHYGVVGRSFDIVALLVKHVFKKRIDVPSLLEPIVRAENKKGFAGIFVVATKQ